MLHTNVAELRLLFNTFTRVWSSGGQANLSLQTKDGQTWAKLDLQLGPADGRRPGPPEAGGRPGAVPWNHQEQPHRAPHLHPQARRKGPAARARDDRRRQDWLAKRQQPAQEQSDSRTALEQEQEDQDILQTSASSVETETETEIPQLDGPAETDVSDISAESVSVKKETDPVILELQDNGYAKIVTAPDEPPPTQVFHPKLGIGTSPRHSKLKDKNCVEYTFKTGKFHIELFP